MTTRTPNLQQRMTSEHFKTFGDGYLPGLLGVEIVSVSEAGVESRLAVRREVMAPNGFPRPASRCSGARRWSCGPAS